jgi:hypothetical protein
MPAGNAPLLAALTALVEADPQRGAEILRKAIVSLAADGTRALGRPSTKDGAAWAPIRERLRRAMAGDKLTAMQLAERLGLSESIVDKCAAPNGPVPSAAVIEKIKGWLAARAKPPAPTGGSNGHALPADRLTEAEAAKLAGFRSLVDPSALRRHVKLTGDEIAAAAAGETLTADVVDRLRAFLGRPGSTL